MRHLIATLGLGLIFFSSLPGQELNKTSVFFESGQSALSSTARRSLSDWLEKNRVSDNCNILINAYTDNRGSEAYNEELARQRAQSVQAILQDQLQEAPRFTTSIIGERDPQFSNLHEEGRQKNRRVDILLQCSDLKTTDDLFRELQAHMEQSFVIDPSVSQVINGRKGTRFWIDAHAILDEEGRPVEDSVILSLREAYGVEDMLAARLGTTAGERLLETGGMLFLNAQTANGEELRLDPEKPLLAAMPTPALKENMELFTAVTDANGTVTDWMPTGQKAAQNLDDGLKLPARPRLVYDFDQNKFAPPVFDPSSLPEPPAAPEKPGAPYKPHKPEREQIRYRPGGIKGLLTNRSVIEAKEEETFQKEMEKYQTARTEYERKNRIYQEKMKTYPLALENYKSRKQAWENMKRDRMQNHKRLVDSLTRAWLSGQYEQARKEHEEELERWRIACEKRVAEFEAKYGGAARFSDEMVNNYFYRINRFGWINCDRFLNIPPEEKRELAIQTPQNMGDEPRVFVVFKDMNSILNATQKGGLYRSQAVPENRTATLVGLTVKEGKPYLALQEITTGAEEPYELVFRETQLSQLRQALERLN